MADAVLAVTVYVVGQLALFALAVTAHVRWKVPIADLTRLLRACVRYPLVRRVAAQNRIPGIATTQGSGEVPDDRALGLEGCGLWESWGSWDHENITRPRDGPVHP